MSIYNIHGAEIVSGNTGQAVDFVVYSNNLKTEIDTNFTSDVSNFTLSGCSASSFGLSFSGFGTAKYDYIENIYYEKAVIKFTYNSAVQLGVFLSGTLVYLDSTGTLALYNGYTQSSTLPSSASDTESAILTIGHEYALSLYRKGFDYAQGVLRDLVSGEEYVVTGGSSNQLSSKTLGIVVFSGTVVVSQLIYKTACYGHSRVLVIGDSITTASILGMESKTFEDSFGYRIVNECFANDGLVSAQGGLGIKGGIQRVQELFARGYRFDFIIVALGTNVDWDKAPNWDYAAQIATRRQTFANFESVCNGYGAVLLWCAPPANPNDDLTESLTDAETDTTTTGYPSRTILRELIIDVFGDRCIRFDLATMTNGAYDAQYFADGLHTNYAGHTRQLEFAKSRLELLGVI